MAYELYQSRYKGFEIDAQLDKVTENATKINALSTSYDANKVMMPDNTTLPSYLANNTFNIDVSEYPGQILEKKGDGYYVPETDLSDYDTSTEVDTKIAAAAYTLPPATDTTLGGVKPDGTTITVDTDGTLHGASAIDNLDDIGDVNVSGATDGQALVYDATNEEWIPGTAGSDSPPEIAIQTSEPTGDEVFWIDPTEGMPVLPDDGRQIISGGELEFYTEDERVIGYWTDGRPIYRRVVSGTSSSESGTWIALVTISNIKDMINIYGFATQADGAKIPCNYYRHQSSLTSTSYCATAITGSGSLMFMTKETNMPVKIVMEYTKTTDTAVTNVNNYSTDEIRTNKTWIDGKPIYRKVIRSTIPLTSCRANDVTILTSIIPIATLNSLNIDTVVNNVANYYQYDNEKIPITLPFSHNNLSQIKYVYDTTNGLHISFINKGNESINIGGHPVVVILEYTKTID